MNTEPAIEPRSKQTNKELADRLRKWYRGGEKGLLTVCNKEGAPKPVIDAVKHWFTKGEDRLEAIAKDIENN